MQLQFNEYFVRTKLIPTLGDLLTRISQPVDAQPMGGYLGKLLIPQELSAVERKQFQTEYFMKGQDGYKDYRPFQDQNEQEYRLYLLDELADYLAQQRQLLGPEGLKQNILPAENRDYSSSSELNRHLYQLAYRLVNRLEQRIIEDNNQEMSPEEEEKLQNGQLKMVSINGQDTVIDRDDLAGMPADTVLVPLVQPNLRQRLAEAARGQTELAVTERVISLSKAAMENGFRESMVESTKAVLEAAGLEVMALEARGNVLKGQVKDVNGEILEVEINALSADSDPRKYKFTFDEAVKDRADSRDYRGRYFYLSGNDLERRFMANGQRQPAERVYQNLPPNAKFKGYELPPEEGLPVTTAPLRGGVPTGLPSRPVTPRSESSEEVATGESQVPGALPEGPVREAPSAIIAGRESGRLGRDQTRGERTRGAARRTVETPATEAEVEEELEEERRQQQMAQAAPQQLQMPPLRYSEATQNQMALRQRKKKENRNKILLALGATGAVTAGPVITLLTSAGVISAQEAEKVQQGFTFIIHCIGTVCIG